MYNGEIHQSESTNALIDAALSNVNTAIPGVIQSFDPATQTCSVQCAINRIDTETNEDVKYPLLVDVPVVYPNAGGYYLTFPIKSDDNCLVVFSQKTIDGWFENGEIKREAENRRHDLSDGIAIIGLNNQSQTIGNWNNQGTELRDKSGNTVIHLQENKIQLMIGSTGIEITPDGIKLMAGGNSVDISFGGTSTNSNITTSADVRAGNISLTNHVHKKVTGGNDLSGGAQ